MSASGDEHGLPSEPLQLAVGEESHRGPHIARMPAPEYGPAIAPVLQRKHFYEYLRVVYKRRWAALTAFVICASLVGVKTFTTIPL